MTTNLFRRTLRSIAASLFGTTAENRHPPTRRSRSRRARMEPLESRQLLSLSGWSIGIGSPAGGSGNVAEYGWDAAADANGNVYVTGRFEQTVDFDPGPGVVNLSEADGNAFVAKYAASGALLWAKPAVGKNGRRIAVDGSGNAYVVGGGALKFWKLDSDGNTVWSGAPDVDGLLNATDVAVDGAGDVYLSGSFRGTARFGKPGSNEAISLTSAGGSDIYVAKYDPNGEIIWAKRAGAPVTFYDLGNDVASSLAIDDDGSVYATGTFDGIADFGDQTLASAAPGNKDENSRIHSDDIFVTQLSMTDGAFKWAVRAGGTRTEFSKSVAVDGNGDVYITGEFVSATADFGPHRLTNLTSHFAGRDAFVSKLSSTGSFLWARGFAGDGFVNAWDVIDDGAGGIYFTGDFRSTATIGPFELTHQAPGGSTGFVASLDGSGAVLSAQEVGVFGALGDVGDDGSLYLTSSIFTDATGEEFPTGESLVSTPTVDGSPSFDIFITKMEPGAPNIRSLIASPDPVGEAGVLRLSADGVLDIGGQVTSVDFYRDINNDGVPDAGELLGTDSDVSDAWSLGVDTAGLPAGTYTFLAVATDNDLLTSEAATATATVDIVTAPTADLTGNGFVDFEDLTVLLANWNRNVSAAEGNLVDAVGTPVNFEDLNVLLAAWTGPGGAASPQAAAVRSDRIHAVGQDPMNRVTPTVRRGKPAADARNPLRRLQAAAVDRAMNDESDEGVVTRRSRRDQRSRLDGA